VFVGYFDESGLDERSKIFCIAGYVAESGNWFELTRTWKSLLAEAGVACFHMADFENRQGEFEGWTNEKRIGFINDLITLVNSTDVWGIASAVVRPDYDRLSAEFIAQGKVTPHWYGHPYLLAFQHCLIETCVHATDLHPSEKIAFVFDQQADFHARAEAVYHELREGTSWPRAFRLGSLHFASKHDAVPLQVADLLVYDVRKALDHKLFEPDRGERKSMARLRRRLINFRYFDEAAIRAVIKEFEKSRSPSSQDVSP
jgi:hypothetical protein